MSQLKFCEPIKSKYGSQQKKSKPLEIDGFKTITIKQGVVMIDQIDKFLMELGECKDIKKAMDKAGIDSSELMQWYKEYRFFRYAIAWCWDVYVADKPNQVKKVNIELLNKIGCKLED